MTRTVTQEGEAVAAASTAPRRAFRPELEGVRGVAILMVVAFHLVGWPRGGFVAIDLFFVLSGFLITGLLVKERTATGRISLREFYARRARRILPMAVVVLFATDLAARAVFWGSRASSTEHDSLWALFFSANIHFAMSGANYLAATAPPSALQHYWSLGVEEQYYLLWPGLLVLAAWVAARRGWTTRGAWSAVLLVVTAASFTWSVYDSSAHPASAYFSTFTRVWELGIGGLLALQQPILDRIPVGVRRVQSWIGVAGLVGSSLLITAAMPIPGVVTLMPVTAMLLILIAGPLSWTPTGRFGLSSPPLRYIGRISYSIYLWHWPIVILGSAIWPAHSAPFYTAAITLTVILPVLSYHFVEAPARDSSWLSSRETKRKYDARRSVDWSAQRARLENSLCAVIAATAGLAVVVSFVKPAMDAAVPAVTQAQVSTASLDLRSASPATVLRAQLRSALLYTSWPKRLDPSLGQLNNAFAPQWINDGCLDVDASNMARCRFGAPNATHHAAILGDSIAISYLPGLLRAFAPYGWDFQLFTMRACNDATLTVRPMPSRPVYSACAQHRNWAIGVIRQMHPDVLFMADEPWLADVYGVTGLRAEAAAWQAGMTSVFESVRGAATHEVFVSAPPNEKSLQTCATRLNKPSACVSTPPSTSTLGRAAERAAAKAAGMRYVNVLPWFCIRAKCPPVVDGVPVLVDGVHLTAAFSRHLGPELFAALAGIFGIHPHAVTTSRGSSTDAAEVKTHKPSTGGTAATSTKGSAKTESETRSARSKVPANPRP